MKQLEFEWDKKKEKTNAKKHGVTFDEARTVFYDEQAIQFYDPEHSDEEDRFILLGAISARKADAEEEQVYWSNRKNERTLRLCKYEREKEPLCQVS